MLNQAPRFVYASVLTDIACAACLPFDGREYPSIAAAGEQFIDGGRNKDCEKGGQCTCSLVAVGEESASSA